MRAVSTILAGLLLSRLAVAQGAGDPGGYEPNAFWLTFAGGFQRGASISDKQSGGGWRLDASRPVTLSVDWGRAGQTIGVHLHHNVSAMVYEAASCAGCKGEIQSQSLMATYRRSQVLARSRLRQFVELGAGLTRWSALRSTDENRIPGISPIYDFTYAAAIGVGYPFSDPLMRSRRLTS
ncbi:MAG: hypothetical protein ACYC7F_14065 [Gemmatimonadaceae bacterium]